MKKLLVVFLITLLNTGTNCFGQANPPKSDTLVWYTDIMKAQEVSKATNKPIFAFFTGSDWCGWCKKMQRDVFAKKEFLAWAPKNVILLELDFPRGKQLPQEIVQQNNSLQQTFQVKGFPTVWMFYLIRDEAKQTFNISAIGSLGYPQGAQVGKEEAKFLNDANDLISKYALQPQ